jgi:Bacterial Ig-like domain
MMNHIYSLACCCVIMMMVTASQAATVGSRFDPLEYNDNGDVSVSSGTLTFDVSASPPTYSGATNGVGELVTNESQKVVMALYNFKSLNIGSGVNVVVANNTTPSNLVGIVLGSKSTMSIGATINLDGKNGVTGTDGADALGGPGGPGAEGSTDYTATMSAPPDRQAGIGGNGRKGTTGTPPRGHGLGAAAAPPPSTTHAGGGGGYGGEGGDPTTQVGYGGVTYGYDDLYDLLGGSGGGGSRRNSNTRYASGGGGGGAMELTAAISITLTGTLSAEGGAGGNVTTAGGYSGGGGSGGGILLNAPVVTLESGSVVSVNGGKGGDVSTGATGGGGGGGRIAIYTHTLTTNGTITCAGGDVGNGADAGSEGAPGTDGTYYTNVNTALFPPMAITLLPMNNDTVPVLPSLTVTFSEAITTNTTGSITITNLTAGTADIIPVGSGQLAVSGRDLVITPTTPLSDNTHYAVLIDTDAIKDLDGTFFAGFTNTVVWDWEFTTTTADNDPPSIQATSPADNAIGVAYGADLVATFNERIQKGTGNIIITNLTDHTATIISVTNLSQVSIVGSNMTVNPAVDLMQFKDYAILIDAGAIKDYPAGNAFGISSPTVWNFTTLEASSFTWAQTAAGSSGYWTDQLLWNPSGGYPTAGKNANLTNAINSGAYTCLLNSTLPGTLTSLTLNSGGGAGQAMLVVTNASLTASTLNLGNGGVLRIDKDGAVMNNTAVTGNWWTGTNGAVYLNSGGTFVTTNGTTIGYSASSIKATVSSTDSLGGSWVIGAGGLNVGYGVSLSGNELIISGGVIVTSSGGLKVGYKSSTVNGNLVNNNKLSIQGGARVYTTGPSWICMNPGGTANHGGNSVTVTGADSLWDLGGGDLTVASNNTTTAYSTFDNVLTVTAGGVVTNAGTIIFGSTRATTNYLNVSTGTVYATTVTCGGTTPTVTLGLGGKIVASGAVTMTNGAVLKVSCDSAAPSSCGRMDVAGTLDITGSTLNLTCTGDGTFILATYGSLTGTFSATNGLLEGMTIDYDYQGNQIAVVGKPKGTLVSFF